MEKGKSFTRTEEKGNTKELIFDIVIPYDLKLMELEEIKAILLLLYDKHFIINANNNDFVYDIINDIRNGFTLTRDNLEQCFYNKNLFNRRVYGTLSYIISKHDFVVWENVLRTQKFPNKKDSVIKYTFV